MSETLEPPVPDTASALFTVLLTMTPEALAKALSEDPVRSAPLVQAAAEMGLAAGQVRLGRMLLEGVGVGRNQPAACQWFRRAADQDCPDAWNMLGRCFENGWGVRQDFAQAAHWFARAAGAGDAWAQYNLAHLYLNGQGVARDARLAAAWYQAASDQGHPRAMNLLGRCYEQGWGVDADPAAAADWYRRSAEGGYFRGQYNHASLLIAAGRHDEAIAWFSRAAASAPPASRRLIETTCAERWGIEVEATTSPN